MWISNTATASVMAPLVVSILNQLGKPPEVELESRPPKQLGDSDVEEISMDSAGTIEGLVYEKNSSGYLLGIAFSASIGGTATTIGTGPNLALLEQMKQLFPDSDEISFSSWLVFAFPLAMLLIFITWVLLVFIFIRRRKGEQRFVKFDIISFEEQYAALGRVSFEEGIIMVLVLLMALLWFFRTGIGPIPGWARLFSSDTSSVGDGTVATLCAALLFVFPAVNPLPSKDAPPSPESDEPVLLPDGSDEVRCARRILDWADMKQIPWGMILLFGGGFALARGFISSGLSGAIGSMLCAFSSLPIFLVAVCTSCIITFTTEFTSNVATTNIVLPILASMSVAIGENPLILMISGTLCCSMAFMFPVATPPNAIVFTYNIVRTTDMLRMGLIMKFTVIAIVVWLFLVGRYTFGIRVGDMPAWAS
eukprot:CAMPEP_0177663854 /NCGR_PEP_ID=MMETSP0447-20121125/20151_1 /TAXON_ID=0 /ORGANISM="Stygamoeba regulata, Strain BSH-02190019" /LENGTH=421 /DNA_ID=CAMNT_0019169725 /DNA_START=98 /DNA_END=1359 /DNA_ORIENTATION=+